MLKFKFRKILYVSFLSLLVISCKTKPPQEADKLPPMPKMVKDTALIKQIKTKETEEEIKVTENKSKDTISYFKKDFPPSIACIVTHAQIQTVSLPYCIFILYHPVYCSRN